MTCPVALRGCRYFRGQSMTDATLGVAPQSVDTIQSSYMAQVQRRRLYGGLTLLMFVVLMVSGFNIADDLSTGGGRRLR